jgi:hypothetical protein
VGVELTHSRYVPSLSRGEWCGTTIVIFASCAERQWLKQFVHLLRIVFVDARRDAPQRVEEHELGLLGVDEIVQLLEAVTS